MRPVNLPASAQPMRMRTHANSTAVYRRDGLSLKEFFDLISHTSNVNNWYMMYQGLKNVRSSSDLTSIENLEVMVDAGKNEKGEDVCDVYVMATQQNLDASAFIKRRASRAGRRKKNAVTGEAGNNSSSDADPNNLDLFEDEDDDDDEPRDEAPVPPRPEHPELLPMRPLKY